MAGSVKVGGAWKTVSKASVRVGGVWKNVSKGYTKVGGVWKQWYSGGGPYWIASYNTWSGFGSFARYANGDIVATTATDLIKFDPAGSVIWKRSMSSISNFATGGIALDSSGNIYITAAATPVYSWDAIVIKFDTNGNVIWKKYVQTEAGNGNNTGNSISVAPSGNIYISGWGGAGANNSFTTYKLNSSGSPLWSKTVYNAGGSNTNGIDSSENVYTVGSSADGIYWWLVKYDTNGTIQWHRQMGGNGLQVGPSHTDSSGNTYIAGKINFGDGAGGRLSFVKINSSGTIVLQKSLSTVVLNASGMSVDNAGNIYISGRVQTGDANIFAKWDASGNLIWVRQMGTSTSSSGYESIDAVGDDYFMSGAIAGSISIAAKLNQDGGNTGTYTVGGQSVTYQAVSATVMAQSWTASATNQNYVTNTATSTDLSQAITTPSLATSLVTIG